MVSVKSKKLIIELTDLDSIFADRGFYLNHLIFNPTQTIQKFRVVRVSNKMLYDLAEGNKQGKKKLKE